jgi:hypothetical protein
LGKANKCFSLSTNKIAILFRAISIKKSSIATRNEGISDKIKRYDTMCGWGLWKAASGKRLNYKGKRSINYGAY